MPSGELRYLEIEADQVRRAIDFNVAYARTCVREVEDSRPEESLRWVILADAATALVEACEWAFLEEATEAMELADEAGRLFAGLGHAYGFYLMAVASRTNLAEAPAFRAALEGMRTPLMSSDERQEVGAGTHRVPSLVHAQQQAYLALAGASVGEGREAFDVHLREMVFDPIRGSSTTPVGPLGVPIRRYWAIARCLLEREGETAADHLVAIARTYGEAIESAMANQHTWRHAASPVAVVDVDLVGMTHLAHRVLGAEFKNALEQRLERIDRLATVPVRIGLSIGGTRSEPSPGRSRYG